MGKTPKKSPKKRSDNPKRARPSSTEEEQYGGNEDVLYLELFDLIRTLQAKDETKEEQLKELQEQLDRARDEIKSLKSKVEELKESLEFTQKQQDEANDKIERCEYDQDRQEDELIRQSIYSRRWNLIFYGIPETDDESCSDLIKHTMVSKLKMDQRKVNTTMFCGAHRLGRRKRASNNNKPRPIIVRFTCRADRESTWRQRYNLKGSSTRMAEDLPQNVREIRRDVLVPALKNARKCEGTKATIIGDRLLVNGKRYSFDKIPRKWQNVSQAPDDEMHNATHDEEPEQAQTSQVND